MVGSDTLTTDVDKFIELVKTRKKLTIAEAAHELKASQKTVQAWTDFLVEEKILGVEYKFTTQYIYYNMDPNEGLSVTYSGFDTREEFYDKAKRKGLKETQIRMLWLKYINLNRESMRTVFYDKCIEKHIPEDKIDILWKKYVNYLER